MMGYPDNAAPSASSMISMPSDHGQDKADVGQNRAQAGQDRANMILSVPDIDAQALNIRQPCDVVVVVR
jgi:hypothetical protein